MTVDGHQHRGASGSGQLVAADHHIGEIHLLLEHQFAVPHRYLSAGHRSDSSLTRHIAEARQLGRADATVNGVAHDRSGQGMFGLSFHRSDQSQQLLLGHALDNQVGDLRFTFGQRACLVHDNGVNARRGLQRSGVLEQDAPPLCTQTRAHHDRRGRSQAQCVRAGDDHHRDSEQ